MDEPIGKYFIENDSLRTIESLHDALRPLRDSVYEVVRIIDRRPLFLDDHIQRFTRSASLSGYPLSASFARIRKVVDDLTKACDISLGNVRLVYGCADGTRKSALIIYFRQSRYPDDNMYRSGVRVGLLKGERSSPAIKHSDSPVRKEANSLLEKGGFYEMLLVNDDGFITEASRNNIFFIQEDTLITPPARDVLIGITRQKVLDIARWDGISLVEEPVPRSGIGGFDALFLTGTSAKALPVRSVEDRSFSTDNALLRHVMESYDRYIESYLSDAQPVHSGRRDQGTVVSHKKGKS
jgi:branched-chain amino acid aminotransferase